MHYSSVAAVLQSLHQASEADESSPNFIVADPQKERHMNHSSMGQNNIFSKKERDSLYFIGDSSSVSFSDKKNYDSKMSRKSRDHHRRRVQVRRLSPSPDFRSVHAKKVDSDLASTYSSRDNRDYLLKRGYVRKFSSSPKSSVRRSVHSRRVAKKRKGDSDLTSTSSIEGIYSIYRQRNSFKRSRLSQDHHRRRFRESSESSNRQFARQSTPDYQVYARYQGRTRRDSSDSSSESKDSPRNAKFRGRIRRDSSDCSAEFNFTSKNSRCQERARRDSSNSSFEFKDVPRNAQYQGRRDSSDSSDEFNFTSRNSRCQERTRRDSSNSSFEFKYVPRNARFQGRRRNSSDSSSEFSDSSTVIARKQVIRWLNDNNFNEVPHEFIERFTEENFYKDEGTFETNFNLNLRKENNFLKDAKNDSGYSSNQSNAHNKEDEEQIDLKQGNLRPIIIDGANIGHKWGRNRFSAVGYEIVYNHFKKELGYPDNKIVIVHKYIPSQHLLDEDFAIIKDFKQKGILINSPSRIVGDGETLIQSDDDVFCLNLAHTHGGIGKKYFNFLINSLLNHTES